MSSVLSMRFRELDDRMLAREADGVEAVGGCGRYRERSLMDGVICCLASCGLLSTECVLCAEFPNVMGFRFCCELGALKWEFCACCSPENCCVAGCTPAGWLNPIKEFWNWFVVVWMAGDRII